MGVGHKRDGFEFLLKAFNSPTYLEDLTGLTQLKQASADFSIDWEELSDGEDFWSKQKSRVMVKMKQRADIYRWLLYQASSH